MGSAAVVAAVIIAGAAGYLAGSQRSRISAAVQNLKAVANGRCPAGQAAPNPSATAPVAAGLITDLLPRPKDATTVKVKQGAISLDDYVTQLYKGDRFEKQRLQDRCFEAAASRSWLAPDGQVIVWLIRFGAADEARSYILSAQQGDLSLVSKPVRYSVPGVSDGMGIGQPVLDRYGNTLTRLLGDHGNVAIIIHYFVPGRLDNTSATTLLQRQFAKLG